MTFERAANGSRISAALRTVLVIGLIAGTLDMSDAIIYSHIRGVTAERVCQYIASGLIGMKSFSMGATSAALGLMLHYFIALSWTAIFYMASRRLMILTRHPILSGLVYGLAVYLFMNLIVVPLSGVPRPKGPPSLVSRVNGVLAVVLCIGLTISLLVSRWAPTGRSKTAQVEA
jgi:hypothetical protein